MRDMDSVVHLDDAVCMEAGCSPGLWECAGDEGKHRVLLHDLAYNVRAASASHAARPMQPLVNQGIHHLPHLAHMTLGLHRENGLGALRLTGKTSNL